MTAEKNTNRGTIPRVSPWILGFVLVYSSLQILIPLRHVLYKRDLRWTHEGSNFSWRMMADHHETNGGITIEDPRTGDVYAHSPENLLNDRQLVMVNNPYMLFQYIQYLKQYLNKQTDIRKPIIKADIQMSVNGGPFQALYDPTCNLSDIDYSPFRDLKWIEASKKN